LANGRIVVVGEEQPVNGAIDISIEIMLQTTYEAVQAIEKSA